MPGVEVVMQESPVGDHAANGLAENAVKEVKGSMRAIKHSLEERLGVEIKGDRPILTWLPRRAAACIPDSRLARVAKHLSRGALENDGRTLP